MLHDFINPQVYRLSARWERKWLMQIKCIDVSVIWKFHTASWHGQFQNLNQATYWLRTHWMPIGLVFFSGMKQLYQKQCCWTMQRSVKLYDVSSLMALWYHKELIPRDIEFLQTFSKKVDITKMVKDRLDKFMMSSCQARVTEFVLQWESEGCVSINSIPIRQRFFSFSFSKRRPP